MSIYRCWERRSYKFSLGTVNNIMSIYRYWEKRSYKFSSGYSQQHCTVYLQTLREEILQVLRGVRSTTLYCLSIGTERDLISSHQGTVNNTMSVYRHWERRSYKFSEGYGQQHCTVYLQALREEIFQVLIGCSQQYCTVYLQRWERRSYKFS